MFGRNAITKSSTNDAISVQEVFYTIQGEGPLAGLPAVFVRLNGCNLRCFFCDTDFESNKNVLDVPTLVRLIETLRGAAEWVVITGGEPLLQEIGPLVVEIIKAGLQVQIETAGTVWPRTFEDEQLKAFLDDDSLMIVCSPKTGKVHDAVVKYCRDWKYIIDDVSALSPVDGLPDSSTQIEGQHNPIFRARYWHPPRHRVWVQPCEINDLALEWDVELKKSLVTSHRVNEERSSVAMDRAVEVCLKYGYRLSVQTHKIARVR